MKSAANDNWQSALFYLGLALLACHELDAVARHEWRLLPILKTFSDDVGLTVFVLGHIPIFAGIFWAVGHANKKIRRTSQLIIDGFLIAHAIAHAAMSGHDLYEFTPPVETITVYGGAIFGLIHDALELRRR